MVQAPPKPKTQLRICELPGCWAGADWIDQVYNKRYCKPHAVIIGVNRALDTYDGRDNIRDVLGIAHFQHLDDIAND